MATVIDARVKQKTGVAADFAGYTLLEGEIALVRTSASGPVWNFKVGPGNFDSLDWSLQNPGAAQKADTSTVFPTGVPGLYIPTEDGTYEGMTVDLSVGYVQLIWDGSTMVKAEFPIDLSGYISKPQAVDDYGDVSDAIGVYLIRDPSGRVAFKISETGEAGFVPDLPTENRIKKSLHFRDTVSGEFLIEDENGNTAFKVTRDGRVSFQSVTYETASRLGSQLDVSKLFEKKISIIGDSISTDNGGGNAGLVFPQQYWGRLQTEQNCQIYRSAIGGTTITAGGSAFVTDARWQSLNSEFEPDIVLIFGGINDFLQGKALGTIEDGTTATFYGALRYLYSSILDRMPLSRVYHMTPAHTTHNQSGSFPSVIPEYNANTGLFLADYVKAIEEVSRLYGVGIIDVNRDSGITQYNINTLSDDTIHFKAKGHEMVYNLIVGTLNSVL